MNQKNPFLHCFFPDSKFIFLQYFMFPGVKPLGAALPAARGWKLPEGHAEHPIKILLKVRQKNIFLLSASEKKYYVYSFGIFRPSGLPGNGTTTGIL